MHNVGWHKTFSILMGKSLVLWISSTESQRHSGIWIFDWGYFSFIFVGVCVLLFVFFKLLFFLSCYEVNFHRSLLSLLKLSLVHVYTYHVVILGEMLQVLAQQERIIELWFHICETDGREDICFLHRKETFCHKFYGRCCF